MSELHLPWRLDDFERVWKDALVFHILDSRNLLVLIAYSRESAEAVIGTMNAATLSSEGPQTHTAPAPAPAPDIGPGPPPE